MYFNRFEPLKVLAQYDKLVELSRGNICAPSQIMVYPSNICNLDCPHCIMRDLRADKAQLSKECLNRLVKDCISLGIKLVNIAGGGEPTTNINLHQFILDLKAAGIQVSLTTNGLNLMSTLPVDFLRVSIDAGSREVYKTVKGADRWESVTTKLQSYKKYGELGLAFLLSHENYHDLENFLQWAQQFDYDFIHVRPAYWPEYDLAIKYAVAEVEKKKYVLESKYRGLNIRTDKFESQWQGRKFNKCRATGLKAVLTADGSFIPCQDKFIKFGNYNTQTFEEIWYGSEHRDVIENNDLSTCPRCVEDPTNEIIEHCVMGDKLKINLF